MTGNQDIRKPWLWLAPMAGVANWAFREICYSLGAELAMSHPVPVGNLIARPEANLAAIGANHDAANPFVIQLIGHEPEEFRCAARIIADNLPVAGLNLNMGCPVGPVVKGGNGSALLREPALAAAIVAAMCAGTNLPVSVKMRSGWHDVVAPELAVSLAAAGAKALIIHGRTREQFYRGETDLQTIAAVKRAVSIPVIGNGDVVSVATARQMLEATGVDGIMIGRGAVGNPWLFAELQAELKNNTRFPPRPVLFGDVIRRQVELAVASLGLDKAIRSLRRHLIAYTHGTPSGSKLRTEVAGLHFLADIEGWITRLEASIPAATQSC